MSDDEYRKRPLYVLNEEQMQHLLETAVDMEDAAAQALITEFQCNPHARKTPTSADGITDMLRRFDTGDRLDDYEVKRLYDMFTEVCDATTLFPMYGATRYHAIQQMEKLEGFMWGRGMQALIRRTD
jgi:hypothetical protein